MKRAHSSPIIRAQDSDVEFAIFLEEQREFEQRCRIEEAQNAFLDAYSAWRKHPRDRAMKAHLIWCAAYLSYLDPTFRGPRTLRRYYTPTPIG
jgi:hypothetical protein